MRSKALLVGVNVFRNSYINSLRGCVNDVLELRKVLKEFFGFRNIDIHCLLNERATKEMIMMRLKYLVNWAMPGDRVIFLLSSHGSRIRDRHGDELKDGMDELVCPFDMDWESGQYILDDEFNAILKSFKTGVHFEAILDTCHSGTGMRLCAEPSAEYRQSKFIEAPLDIQLRAEGEEDELAESNKILSGTLPAQKTLWAACNDSQTSADAYFNGVYNGAFTYHFTQIIRKNKGHISRRSLLYDVRTMLRDAGFDQIPQLETESDALSKNVFSY